MNETRFGTSSNPTTAILKSSPLAPIPEIRTISDSDLRCFTPTGITAKIPTPFAKISTSALFGVEVSGFVPPFSMSSEWDTPAPIFVNLFPVQATAEGKRLGVKIVQEMSQLMPIINYISHRFISGNVGIAIRVSSNTALTGNFYVSQGSGMIRDYYTASDAYEGLRFLNASDSGIDYAQGSCTILDVSLNRNLSITPISRNVTQKTDLARKFIVACDETVKEELPSITEYNIIISQFPEDWLLFTPVSDFAGIAANQLSFTFFFDFSRVNFYTPMLAMMPQAPYSTSEKRKEVFDFSATFNGQTPNIAPENFKFLQATTLRRLTERERFELNKRNAAIKANEVI
jgi:hypothetical protein